MSALEFIASVAWPIAVLAIALLFRKPIVAALESATGRLRAGPFEMAWEQTVSTVELEINRPPAAVKEGAGAKEKLDQLADISPPSAVVEAYGRIEASLRSLLMKHGVKGDEHAWSVRKLADLARQDDLITEETRHAIEGLRVLRNLAAHGKWDDLSAQRAREFVALADGVIFAINAGS
jgi:hypothetical protein